MIKRYLVIGIILLFIFMSINPSFAVDNVKKSSTPVSNGNTLYVGGNGPDNYTHIQDAVSDALDGDTVFVFGNGSPYHEHVFIYRSISLIGEDKNLVVIDANYSGTAVKIIADDVFVSGFTMIHPREPINEFWDSTLVYIFSAENVTIKDNIIQHIHVEYGGDRAGVVIRDSSYCFIQNNTINKENDVIEGRNAGVIILLDSVFINISGNDINHYTWGIYIKDGCPDNEIYRNHLHHNRKGIDITSSNSNTVVNNIINFNIGQGIRIEEGNNNVISGNIITDNGEGDNIDNGIGLTGGSDNYISYNYISNNNPSGIYLLSYNNYITLNNISKNKIGVFVDTNYGDYITKNNFIQNEKNGYFDRWISIRDRVIWKWNYWNEPRTRPYPIFGIGHLPFISFKWVNFDWHPAQEPYDIPVGV